jgi:hypothetical protein
LALTAFLIGECWRAISACRSMAVDDRPREQGEPDQCRSSIKSIAMKVRCPRSNGWGRSQSFFAYLSGGRRRIQSDSSSFLYTARKSPALSCRFAGVQERTSCQRQEGLSATVPFPFALAPPQCRQLL